MFLRLSDFISKHLEKIVLILAIALSIASFVYYYHAGLITVYGDSRVHLGMSRRIFDSLTPGFGQIGGYWLPLLHILMLPTIWNDFMWQSGISGAIPNMIAFVLTVFFMYRLVLYITKDKVAAFIGASVFLFNPNLLYMQATPMTESLFIMTIVGFMYFFSRWFREKRLSDLVFAALFLILCSLNRYEGWGLVIAANTLMVWYWIQTKFDRKVEGATFAFATLSFLGIFLWMTWGAIVFHDPLQFLHDNLGAVNQTKTVEGQYDWTGQWNLRDAILTNVYSIAHTSGWYLVALAILATILYLFRYAKNLLKGEYIVFFLLLVPLAFDILTVYTGKVPVEVPELSRLGDGLNRYNIRYALYTLPYIALIVPLIFRRRYLQLFIFVFIVFSYANLVPVNGKQLITLQDVGISNITPEGKTSLDWFKENYREGLILVSLGAYDGGLYTTGIHQKNFIGEGSYKYWDESLKNPAKYATWVILSKENSSYGPRDLLLKKINLEALMRDFTVVEENNGFMILKRIEKSNL